MDYINDMHEFSMANESFITRLKELRAKRRKSKISKIEADKKEASKAEVFTAADGTKFAKQWEAHQHDRILKFSVDERRKLCSQVIERSKKILDTIQKKYPGIRGYALPPEKYNDIFLNGSTDTIGYIKWDAYACAKFFNTDVSDLWDSEDVAAAINDCDNIIISEMSAFLKSKNIAFTEIVYGGDWDDGPYIVTFEF